MTVRELIENLSAFPPELPVVLYDDGEVVDGTPRLDTSHGWRGEPPKGDPMVVIA